MIKTNIIFLLGIFSVLVFVGFKHFAIVDPSFKELQTVIFPIDINLIKNPINYA